MKYLITLLLLLSACDKQVDTLPFFNTPEFTPEWISKDSPSYATIHRVPAFAFVNQEGDTITEKTIDGRITVVDFFFTICPGICPRLTKSMGDIQKVFEQDESVKLLSHSVTPDMDNVERLKIYAEAHHVNSRQWHLLTGDRARIYHIARHGYFADEETGLKKSDNEFLHTENFILIDGLRRIRGVYNGTNPAEVARLIEDIQILKKEMNENS